MLQIQYVVCWVPPWALAPISPHPGNFHSPPPKKKTHKTNFKAKVAKVTQMHLATEFGLESLLPGRDPRKFERKHSLWLAGAIEQS